MSLTIAQFTADLNRAGQQRVVVDLAKGFRSKGHRSLVCTTLSDGELEEELKPAGIGYRRFNLSKNYDLRAVVPIMKYLREQKIDVVITHGFYGSFIPRVSTLCARIPAFLHVEHNVSDQKRFYHVLINNFFSLFTDRIVCVSSKARESLLEIEKPVSSKVAVIPNGLNTERFSGSTTINRPRDVKRVGIVGRFYEQKGHRYFIDAAALILQRDKAVEFVFVGDGPLRSDMEKRVLKAGIEAHCHFYGERSDIGELLRTFDVFVLSSLWEGLSISLLEAQFLGVPSVVTAVGGNPEIIRDGWNGLLVPPENPEQLASAVLRVLGDEALQRKFSENAKRLVAEKYTVDTMVNAYLELISELVKKPKNGWSGSYPKLL